MAFLVGIFSCSFGTLSIESLRQNSKEKKVALAVVKEKKVLHFAPATASGVALSALEW